MDLSLVVRGALLGGKLGFERLRHRRVAGALILATAVAVAGALIERAAGSLGAVERALAGTFRLVIPLLTFALVGRAETREGVYTGSYPLARFGLPRFSVALGLALSAGFLAAVSSAVLACLTVVFASSPSSPPMLRDALLSGWIGVAIAMAYASWFTLGGTFFRGRGRFVPLFADFLIGGSTGLAGALLPRAHASSLLGLAEGPLVLPPIASYAVLYALTLVLLAITALRTGR